MGPKAPDIAAAAMTREAQTVMPVAAAQEQKMAARVAEQVRLKNSREAMKIPRGTLPDQHKSDRKRGQIGVEGVNGVTRGPDGKKILPTGAGTEGERFDRITTADASARRFLTEGYDKLPAADKTKMREAVLKAARKSPLIAVRLRNAGVTKASLDAFADGIIKEDPKFAAEVAENFDRWIATPDIADSVTPLTIKATEAKYKKETADIDFKDTDNNLTDAKKSLKEFDRPPVAGTKAAVRDAIDLSKLQGELPGYQQLVATAQKEMDALIAEKNGRASGTPGRTIADIEIAMGPVRTRLEAAQKEVNDRQGEIAKATAFDLEEARLKSEVHRLDRDKVEKEKDQKLADIELTNANGLLGDAKRLRESDETDVVKGIEDVFLRAAEGTFDNETGMFLEAADEQVEAFSAQATEANQKGVDKILQERYWKNEKRRKWLLGPLEDKPVIKRAEVNKDFATLMRQGPEATMKQILAASKNPTTNANYTTAEIDTLMQDKAYVEKVRPEMLKYLMVQRMTTSGITQEDTRIITMSTWGEGIITSAIEKNKEIRAQIEGLIGEGALQRHGFMERLKDEMTKNPTLWLLMLAGGLVVSPIGALTGAGYLAGAGSGMALGSVGAAGIFGSRAHEIAPEDEAARAA